MKSMTGFGRGSNNGSNFSVSVELSTVNRKNLDIRVGFPREYLALEVLIREKVSKALARGIVTGSIIVSADGDHSGANKINTQVLNAYWQQLNDFHTQAGIKSEPDTARLLSLPGVLDDSGKKYDEDELLSAAANALEEALEVLIENREREGLAMKEDFVMRLGLMRSMYEQIEKASEGTLAQFREKLLARVREAGLEIEVDNERLVQEVVLYADRSDITEEIVRMRAHLDQFEKLLEKPAPVGREFDFLLQEMGREINTTGSKSSDSVLSSLVVTFKAELDKCREQIANVE